MILIQKKNLSRNFLYSKTFTCFLNRKIAKKIDVDSNGFITKEELQKWVQENHMKYLIRNAIDYIVEIDLNNDTKMSFQEYEDSYFVQGNKIDEKVIIKFFF